MREGHRTLYCDSVAKISGIHPKTTSCGGIHERFRKGTNLHGKPEMNVFLKEDSAF